MNKKLAKKFFDTMAILMMVVSGLILMEFAFSIGVGEIDAGSPLGGLVVVVSSNVAISMLLLIRIKEIEKEVVI